MFRTLLAIAFLAMVVPSSACEYVDVGLFSHHFEQRDNDRQAYDETNKKLGCENFHGLNFGYFENSHGWDTVYLGSQVDVFEWFDGRLTGHVEYGLWKGYRDKLLNIGKVLHPAIAQELPQWLQETSAYLLPRLSYKVDDRLAIDLYSLWSVGLAVGFKVRI